jgi:putative ubiquitin-RnfH superfamily antitoxin RatB of RatAB toxin-antitoxin module
VEISVVYATQKRQFWLNVELPDGARAMDAIERSGVLNRFPEIDLAHQKVGIFSRIVALDAPLEDGDRVEIYRPLTADPKKVKQKDKPPKSADPSQPAG